MKKYMRILADDVAFTATQLDAIDGAEPSVEHPNAAGNVSNLITNTPRGRVFCRVANTDGANSITVTAVSTAVVVEGSSGNLTVEDPVITLAHGEVKVLGPWSTNFEQIAPNAGKVRLTWACGSVSEADVDVEVYKIV